MSQDSVHNLIRSLVTDICKQQGVEICLISGTDINHDPYPTTEDAHELFYQEWSRIEERLNELESQAYQRGYSRGEEAKAEEIKSALFIYEEKE